MFYQGGVQVLFACAVGSIRDTQMGTLIASDTQLLLLGTVQQGGVCADT